jgi:hypothetical protein
MKPTRPTDQELSGMTVNERLFSCGLLEQWDKAAHKRERIEMIAILRQVALSEEQAAWTTDTILKNPAKYGF